MRRVLLLVLLVAVIGVFASSEARAQSATNAPIVKVYKEPQCQCCDKWVAYMRDNGYQVQVIPADYIQMKRKLKVPKQLGSCHTAEIGGYAIEGHVPVEAIKLLLIQKPQLAGIAVPGMPMGTPGMEGPKTQHYNVVGFYKDGETVIFMKY